MADYSITAVDRRVVYSGSAGTGPYAFTFPVLATSDIAVYKDSTKLVEGSGSAQYTVSLSASTGTGSVTLGAAATGSNTITITGARSIQRTTDFVTAGDLLASSLNTELDSQTIFVQQASEDSARAIKAPVYDPTSIDMTLPAKADRLGKLLGFDSSTGNPEATTGRVNTVSVSTSTVGVGGSATGSVSYSDSSGAMALSLGIPTGATGATGPSGAAATIAVGSVTTGSAGSSATVSNAGSSSAATFNFGIPQGAVGAQGPTGATGPAGPAIGNLLTTRGDIVIRNATEAVRLGIGAANRVLISDGTDPSYGQVPLASAVSGQLPLANGGTGAASLAAANIVATNAQNTFTKAQVPSTYTAALSATSGVLDYDTYTNFIITLASGSNTLAAPTTEASQIGQCGVIIFIQPSSSSAGTLSLHGDYETAGAAGITLSTANSAYDVVPYIIKADNSVLLGAPQLAFG